MAEKAAGRAAVTVPGHVTNLEASSGRPTSAFQTILGSDHLWELVLSFIDGKDAAFWRERGDLAVTCGHDALIYDGIAVSGFTAASMVTAAKDGRLEMVQYLHAQGVESDMFGALREAARGGHDDVVEWLLRQGATPNAAATEQVTMPTPQPVAQMSAQRFFRQPPPVTFAAAIPCGPETPLHVAAAEGHTSTALTLLEYGANVNAHGQEGATPLHRAVSHDDVKMGVLLLQHGADSTLCDREGDSPLHIATRKGSATALQTLLDMGAPAHFREQPFRTLLHEACRHGQRECALLLLDRGADLFIADAQGYSALDYAMQRASQDMPFTDAFRVLVRERKLGMERLQDLIHTDCALAAQEGGQHRCE